MAGKSPEDSFAGLSDRTFKIEQADIGRAWLITRFPAINQSRRIASGRFRAGVERWLRKVRQVVKWTVCYIFR